MALEQAGVSLIAAGGDVYITTINQATKATDSFVDATDKGSGRVSAAGQVMIGSLRKIGEIAVDAFAEATKATTVFLKDSVDKAGDFEAGMKSFQVAAGKGVDTKGLEQFHDLFLQLGKDLPVSTSDVQKAAIELVKGGIDPATVAAGGLKQAIQFAGAAMEGDLVGAAEISSKIVAGWAEVNATAADKATLLTHATDLLTKAANASSTDVNQLSRGLFNAQGIAKTAGVSLDDLTTVIGELAGDFSSSAEAGTSLKNMIARLQPTTDPAASAMEGLGLYTEETGSKFYDAAGNFVGFEKASQLLHDSLQGLTKEQQAATLQTIFGNDAMAAAAGLASRGADGYQAFAAQLTNAMGVQEAGATVQSGYNVALENAKGSVEAFQIQLGEHLLPILTSLLNDVIAPGVNTLATFADAVFGNDDAFAQLSPTLQAVVSVIDVVVADVQEIIGAFNEAGAGSSEFGESIGLLASDLGLPGDLIEDIVFGIQGLVKWFGAASDESGALDTVLVDLSDTWDNVLYTVQDVGNGYMAIAQSVLPVVTKFWTDHGTEITAFLQGTYDKIIEIVNLALDLYDAVVPKVLHSVAQFIDDHGTAIQAVLSGAWQAISGIVTGALTLIEGTIKIALDLINGDWSKAWADLQAMSATFVTSLWQVIKGGLEIIAGGFDTSLAQIGQTWQHNWDMLVEIAMKVGDRMVDAGAQIVAGIVSGIEDNASKLISTVEHLIDDAIHAALHAAGIESPAKEFMPVGEFSVLGIMQGFVDTWPVLTDQIGSLSKDLIGKMQGIGAQARDAIADAFGATGSIDRQIAANLDKLKDVLPEYLDYTTGALKQVQQEAQAMLDPAEGAKYFKMRSDQILEYAALQKKLSEAQNAEDQERIKQQMLLINAAQQASISEYNARQQGQQAPTQAIAEQINALLSALTKFNLTDEQIHWADQLATWLDALGGVPHRATGGPVDAGAPYWVGEHGPELFWPTMDGMISPVASASQMAARGNTTNYNTTTSYSMPVYTNNSPAALQQSWQIMQASMP